MNIRLVQYTNGRFVSGCQMVRYTNGGLKTGLKKACQRYLWDSNSNANENGGMKNNITN